MNAALKILLTFVIAYIVTLFVGAISSGVIMLAMQPRGCGAYGRALMVILGTIAAEFFLSFLAVSLMGFKLTSSRLARLGLAAGYGLSLLGTFAVLALSLMVAFNC